MINNQNRCLKGGKTVMYQNLKKKSEGFTIIEVLIVLARAGLIMRIVFLAVPALQRNSRNTSRRQDISKLLALATEATNNNNGQVPNTAVCLFPEMLVRLNPGQAATAPGAYYCKDGSTSLSWNNSVTTNATTVDTVTMRSGAICDGTTGNATTTGASARSIVALYTLEIGTKQCQAS